MLAYLQKLKENISLVSIQQDKTESLLCNWYLIKSTGL